jgi:GntR family transcriptional regulator, transcriptional repressor for pyruvate dehydrogenase complex
MTKAPPFAPVSRNVLYVEVAERIRNAILGGELAAGERLPSERELARRFEVSRASLREALRHLQAQGFLAARGRTSPLTTAGPEDLAGHLGQALAHVVKSSDVSVADLTELRVAIEGAALAQAARAPRREDLEAARAALSILETPDVPWLDFRAADLAFHAALVAASGNKAMSLVMLAVKDAIEEHLDQTMRTRSFEKIRQRLAAEHRALLSAVERGNARSVAQLVRAHLGEFYFS